MECFKHLLFIYLCVTIAAAYNVKKALRISEGTDDEGIELLVFADPPGPLEKPVFRHHIAHFCPNLDVARECIRTCIKKGKMAFCGKDHVCYCGHRYSAHDKDKEVAAVDIYSQFRDLYKKYFGNPTNFGGTEELSTGAQRLDDS